MYHGPAQEYVQAEILPPRITSIDWTRQPSQFKLYQDAEQLSLPHPLAQSLRHLPIVPLTLEHIGDFLARSYGLLQQCAIVPSFPEAEQRTRWESAFSFHFRRPVPSGGALFPCEVYLWVGEGQDLPAGAYHYDVAHHALDILQQEDMIETVCACLAHPRIPRPACILALSCFFWKDGFKYDSFSYRLQSFDLGTVIAQYVAVLQQARVATTVHYQFLDATINSLLGLNTQHESIYALIALDSLEAQSHPTDADEKARKRARPSAPLLTSIACWPLVEAVHHASLMTTREEFCALGNLPSLSPPLSLRSYVLPSVDKEPALLSGYIRRHSAHGRFIPTPMSVQQLARLCHFSSIGYRNDLDGQLPTLQHTLLYCIVNRVKEVPQGVYFYYPHKHALELVVAGDVMADLQATQLELTRNMHDLSVCFFLVGDYQAGFQAYQDRWYRIQNMEAGMMVQRLYLTAAALELGCRASLGFHQRSARRLLHLPEHQQALIQLLVAPEAHPYGRYELPICSPGAIADQ